MSKNLVIDQKEYTIEDFERIKAEAIEKWRKADTQICKAESIKRTAEDTVRGCNQRIRLLTLLDET